MLTSGIKKELNAPTAGKKNDLVIAKKASAPIILFSFRN